MQGCADCDDCWEQVQEQEANQNVDLSGVPYDLHYSSARAPGRTTGQTINIPLSRDSVPASLKRIEVDIEVAGRVQTVMLDPDLNLDLTYPWDGLDAYGRKVSGAVKSKINIRNMYDLVYYGWPSTLHTPVFSLVPKDSTGEVQEIARRGDMNYGLARDWVLDLEVPPRPDLGGWSLGIHHHYSPRSRTVFRGDGTRLKVPSGSRSLKPLDGIQGFPSRVDLGPTGDLFFVLDNKIFKRTPEGQISHYAGNGGGYVGDGIPARNAGWMYVKDMKVGPDGCLYFVDDGGHRVLKIDRDGIFHTIAGTGTIGYSGDGRPGP